MDPKLVTLRFHEAINARDLDALVALLTEDHVLEDTARNRTTGREAVTEAWRAFFAAFPDYRNFVDVVRGQGPRVTSVGHSECSHAALAGRCAWVAHVEGDRVAGWQIFDTDPDAPPVSPYLYYRDLAAALAWLSRAFGFVERGAETITNDQGVAVHAAMDTDTGLVLLGHPGDDYQNPKQLGHHTNNVYVYVDDIDTHFARARREDAKILEPLTDTSYGDRRYGAEDLEGHHWYFAEKKAPTDPRDLANH